MLYSTGLFTGLIIEFAAELAAALIGCGATSIFGIDEDDDAAGCVLKPSLGMYDDVVVLFSSAVC
jgi:hypothetical protein